ncbi:siroheme synthase [Peniophora sp. CONT]|nr:siroheme synthase [Peniophora sp. CONT]
MGTTDEHGSLLVAWQLDGRTVLIVGGGEVASGRIENVLAAGASITLVCPAAGLHPLTKDFLTRSTRITHRDRNFELPDLDGVDMVLTAIDDVDVSRAIGTQCRERRIPVNVADDPSYCDFYFGSQIRRGPLQIMVSTNGKGPKLANIIRKRIEDAVPEGAGDAIVKTGTLRERLKERAPGVGGDVGRRRMRWMINLCNQWDMDDLARLEEDQMDRLLDEGWENNRVPSSTEIGLSRAPSRTSTTTLSSQVSAGVGLAIFALGALCGWYTRP